MKKILLFALLILGFITQLPIEQKIIATTDNLDKYFVAPKYEFELPSYVPLNEVSSFSNIVIFIRFNDEASYTAPYSYSYYNAMYNGLNEVSLRDYYLEVSYNQLTIDSYLSSDGTQIIFYTDIYNRSYYQPYDTLTNPNGYDMDSNTEQADREHSLLKRAIDFVDASGLIDPGVNLDSNGDGDIDSLSFLVSGEDDGWNSLLWPHQWSLYTYFNGSEYTADAPMINGSYAYSYTMQLLGNTRSYNNKVDVFVLAHEMFHVLGAADLYHYYAYDYIDNVGQWGLMDYNATIPAHMLGYMKEYYGHWIDQVDQITTTGTYTLYPLSSSQDNLYKIDTGYSNEFVYIEYRKKTGLYETQLPDSGLIAYRVDFDNASEGNVDGYYGSNGESSNEVFVFRPGINDTIPPIEFPETTANDDFDGNVSLAAMSNLNPYNSAGGSSQIMLFHSDGSLMDLRIQNVTEYTGYITFDVILPASINLVIDGQIDPSSDVYLYNDISMDYQVEVLNIGSYQAYYTLDGTIPTVNDNLYLGPVNIDASNNQVNVAIYNGQTLIDSISKNFDFVDQIESDHFDYGDLKNITWIISPGQFAESFNVLFSEDSEFEDGFDYVYVSYQGITTSYTGFELASELYESIDSTMIIQLITDDYVSDSYGFSTEITYDIQYPLLLNGEASAILSLGETYSEMGATILPAYQALYTLRIDGTIDTSILGEQYLYYQLLDQANQIVYTLVRTVTVVTDNIAPTFDAIDNQIIELGRANIDWTTLITNAFDNSGGVLTFIEVSDLVVYNQVGTYRVTVSVTDASGNATVKHFDVTVSDSSNPIVTLKPSVDSIYVGDVYVDQGVNVSDSTPTTIVVQGEVDVTRPGIYQLTYIVTDAQLNETQIVRYVHVSQAKITIEFILGDAKTTIAVGEIYVDGICNVKLGFDSFTCDVKQNNVDINAPGIYMITYSFSHGGIEYTHQRYVFVYGTSPLVLHYSKKEEGIVA